MSEEELAALRGRIDDLKSLVAQEVPAEERAAADERVDDLRDAILSDKPEPGVMANVRNWFLRHAPHIAGAVLAVIVDPVIGKLVSAAGDAVASDYQARFDS